MPDGTVRLGLMGDKDVSLREQEHRISWKRFKDYGILEHKLTRVLWPEDLCQHVVSTLKHIGLAFSLSDDEEADLVVLMRLPENRPVSVAEDLGRLQGAYREPLRASWRMLAGTPPGAIEKVLVRCCSLGATSTYWRFGVLVTGRGPANDVGGSFVLLVEYSQEREELTMEAYGDKKSLSLWTALSYAMSAMLSVGGDFPGLVWEACFWCPSHRENTMLVSQEVRVKLGGRTNRVGGKRRRAFPRGVCVGGLPTMLGDVVRIPLFFLAASASPCIRKVFRAFLPVVSLILRDEG